jgi:hypothetical protein
MPHRRDLKGVVHNFLGTYTSRYSDHEGWWIFGLAEAQLGNAQVDLLGSFDRADDPLSAATQMAQAKFAEQLVKAKIPASFIREAHLSVIRAPELSRGHVNGRWCEGHTFTFAVQVVSRHSRTRRLSLWHRIMRPLRDVARGHLTIRCSQPRAGVRLHF